MLTRELTDLHGMGQSRGRMLAALAAGCVGLLCDTNGGVAPLAFAAVMILLLGLPHGASDHLVAMQGRPMRASLPRLAVFLLVYLSVVVLAVLAWRVAPGLALLGFLCLSSVHFGIDDVNGLAGVHGGCERLARGLMPVTLPALIHQERLGNLFAPLSTEADGLWLAQLAHALCPLTIVAALVAILVRARLGEREQVVELGAIILALVAFTPLVGFSLVFALVHCRGQMRERINELSLPTERAYLLACWPTLLGASSLFVALAVLYVNGRAPALNVLFVGLSALTVPHMLVTPLFHNRAAIDTESFAASRQ